MSDNTTPAKEAAEIAKLSAETRQIELDTQLAERLTLAEIARTEAEAAKEAHNAAMAAITLAERKRVEDLTLVQDHYMFHHFFDGTVNEKNVFGALNTMNAWHRQHPNSDWTVEINSPGGSVIDGMHLFDAISAYSKRPWDDSDRPRGTHFTTGIVRGHAASMAGILLQAFDHRVVGPESFIMVHEVSTWAQGKVGELKDEVKFLDKISERVANLFVKRSNGKTTLEDFIKLWERKDAWIDSEEAFERGFVDAIG